MNEQQLIVETSRRIFSDLCTKETSEACESGDWACGLWSALEESGLTLAGIAQESGGSGGDVADALLVIRQAGAFAAPVPIAENFIAATLLSEAEEKIPTGPIGLVVGNIQLCGSGDGYEVSGYIEPIRFGKFCQNMLIVSENDMVLVNTTSLSLTHDVNLAGELVSILQHGLVTPASLIESRGAAERSLVLGAMCAANMMSGAMSEMLDMSVAYALERKQFGRPISQFQAVQQQLAVMAGEVAACQRAADAVLYSPLENDVAIAKARIGEAVQKVADIAHQVHGAMGYTREHPLNLRTRRLWLWRDQYGNERFWQQRLAQKVVHQGADSLWDFITSSH